MSSSSPPSSTSSRRAAGKHVIAFVAIEHVRAAQALQYVRFPVAGQHVVVPGTYNVLDPVIAPVNERITVGIAAARRAVGQVDSNACR